MAEAETGGTYTPELALDCQLNLLRARVASLEARNAEREAALVAALEG